MQELLRDFDEHKQEIESYYKFLRQIASKSYNLKNTRTNKEEFFDVRIVKILKANIFLLLYNLIESTVDSIIDYVCVQISCQNIQYSKMVEELQKQWTKVNTKQHLKSFDEGTLREGLFFIINRTINDCIKFENEYKPKYRDNIGSNELRKIAKDFGFQLNFAPTLRGGSKLDEIKDKRNHLAHGSILFSECGRDYTLVDLTKYKNDTFGILKKFLKTTKVYIEKGKYKSS